MSAFFRRSCGAVALALLGTAAPTLLQGQVAVGAVAGLTMYGLSGDTPDKVSYGRKAGLVAGAVLEIPVSNSVRLVFQPSYAQRNSKVLYDVGDPEPVDTGSVSLDYVSFPILVKILANNDWLYVTSGIDFGYLTSATLTEGATDTDIKSSLKEYDVAVVFGVGGLIPIGRPRVTIEGRYSQSLTNLNEELTVSTGLLARFRSSGFQFLAGILLPLGGER